jgi:hypothetical protein
VAISARCGHSDDFRLHPKAAVRSEPVSEGGAEAGTGVGAVVAGGGVGEEVDGGAIGHPEANPGVVFEPLRLVGPPAMEPEASDVADDERPPVGRLRPQP